jgi:hypothetical protein
LHAFRVIVDLEQEKHIVLVDLRLIALDEGIDVPHDLILLHRDLGLVKLCLVILIQVEVALEESVVQVHAARDLSEELLGSFATVGLNYVLQEVLHLVDVIDEDLKQVFHLDRSLGAHVELLVLLSHKLLVFLVLNQGPHNLPDEALELLYEGALAHIK